jgi:hypothetical protein
MWHNIFALGVSVREKVTRSVLICLFLPVAFRLFGKRSSDTPARLTSRSWCSWPTRCKTGSSETMSR